MAFADGKFAYLVNKLTPSGTITLDRNIGVTSGRLYLSNDNQEEWINFTSSTLSGITYYVLGGVTRDVDPVAVPMTSMSSGKTWLANQKVTLVQAHDQIVDVSTALTATVYANAAARNAGIPSPTGGMQVYLTAEARYEDYQGGVWQTRAAGSGSTTTPVSIQNQLYTYYQDVSGTPNIINISPSPAIGTYQNGIRLQFKPNSTNTGNVTISVNGTTNALLKGSNKQLEPADILNTKVYDIIYSSGNWYILNPEPKNIFLGTYVYSTVGTNINASFSVPILFQAELFDNLNGFTANSTRINISQTGIYYIKGRAGLVGGSSNCGISLKVNGTEVSRFSTISGSTPGFSGETSTTILINAGSYVELFVYDSDNSDTTTTGMYGTSMFVQYLGIV